MKKILVIVVAACLLMSCSNKEYVKENSVELKSAKRLIEIPVPTSEQKLKFNSDIEAPVSTVTKNDVQITGYKTSNKLFMEEVIKPLLLPHLDELKKMHPVDAVNELALFVFDIYQQYFGKDFYRWAGDILDLDDPQSRSIRYTKSYGLDCSGFTASAYELAVYFGILKANQTPFSSEGFKIYCDKNGVQDKGGVNGTSNNYRVDSQEFAFLGNEVLSVPKDGSITKEQLQKLQAGDIVDHPGHVGILVQINGELYYLESGGWVVPVYRGNPFKAMEAIKIFAGKGDLTIRRCLPTKSN